MTARHPRPDGLDIAAERDRLAGRIADLQDAISALQVAGSLVETIRPDLAESTDALQRALVYEMGKVRQLCRELEGVANHV